MWKGYDEKNVKQAFYRSIPVLAGYLVLGMGFGILMHSAGYGVVWAAAMSIFIFAGSMQYVGVGLLTGGATVLTTALTTIIVNGRHLFYSISMIDQIAVVCVASIQVWKRNSLISILMGTIIYMLLIQFVC